MSSCSVTSSHGWLGSPLPVTRFSSRSMLDRRMMGSGGRGVSICPRPFGLGPKVQGSQRDRRAHRPGREAPLHPFGRTGATRPAFSVSGQGLLAEAEVGAVEPHAVQDDGELSGSPAGPWGPRSPTGCDLGPGHAAPLGDSQSPDAQGRPFLAAHRERVRRLVECGSGELVAAAADLADNIRLAGLVSAGRQAEMRADVARTVEPVRPVDGGAIGQRGERADAIEGQEAFDPIPARDAVSRPRRGWSSAAGRSPRS